MDSTSLRRLVEEIAAQVLAEAVEGGTPSPRPVVLMTGAAEGLPVVLHQLQRLQSELGPLAAAVSQSFCELVPPATFTQDTGIADLRASLTRGEAEHLCANASLLLVGSLSDNSRAKMALGIADSMPSVLWLAARAARVPLFIAEPPPVLVTPSTPALSPARLRQREEQLGLLREDGATLIPAGEVFERLSRFLVEHADPAAAKRLREAGPRPIITQEDVERAHRRGVKTWDVPKNAIVTAAAWDRARDLGMSLSGGNLP